MDEGNEFINHHFKGFCRRQIINLFNVNSDKKACVVERFTRTLKIKCGEVSQIEININI